MLQGSSVSPGWFVKVINEVIKDLNQVAAYPDDVIVFDSDPIAQVQTNRSLFERLRKHNVKLPPRRRDWVPQMSISWIVPFPRRAYARTQKTCPQLSICRCPWTRSRSGH